MEKNWQYQLTKVCLISFGWRSSVERSQISEDRSRKSEVRKVVGWQFAVGGLRTKTARFVPTIGMGGDFRGAPELQRLHHVN